MKNMFFAFFFLLPFFMKGQAHLGATLKEIKEAHPNNVFKDVYYTDDGSKYFTSTDMPLGNFSYYFTKETDKTYLCVQVPIDNIALNTLVEMYNKKYVIVSDSTWKAYLDGGAIMNINLHYAEKYGVSIFFYSN